MSGWFCTGFSLVDEHNEPVTVEKQGLLLYSGGTVCDGPHFGPTEMYAICRELGFDDVRAWTAGLEWPSVQNRYSVHIDDVRCLEPYWALCTYVPSNPRIPKCNHTEDVMVTCKGHVVYCPAGQFREYRLCRECPANTYKPNSSTHTSCLPCPSSATSRPGSSYCSCPEGMFWKADSCLPCPQDTVSEQGANECVPCPSSVRTPSQCSCTGGAVWNWQNKQCISCSPGTYKNSLTETCVTCPAGSTSLTGSQYCLCGAGTFWNTSQNYCSVCPAGSISDSGALKCQHCPLGSLENSNQTSCRCSWGQKWTRFSTVTGAGSCTRDENTAIIALLALLVVLLLIISLCLSALLVIKCRRDDECHAKRTTSTNPIPLVAPKYGGMAMVMESTESDRISLIRE